MTIGVVFASEAAKRLPNRRRVRPRLEAERAVSVRATGVVERGDARTSLFRNTRTSARSPVQEVTG